MEIITKYCIENKNALGAIDVSCV